MVVIFLDLQPIIENNTLDIVDHSCSIEVNFSSNRDMDMSVKVLLRCIVGHQSCSAHVQVCKFKAEIFCWFCIMFIFFDFMFQGVLQEIEVMFDGNILLNLLDFYDVFTSFKFHNERVCAIFMMCYSFCVVFPVSTFKLQLCSYSVNEILNSFSKDIIGMQ